jgi:aspartate carbamoyltransferase catalytic subunit
MAFTRKHVLGLQDFTKEEIETIFETADSLKEILGRTIKKVPALRGKSMCTLFYEPSTRTRTSFELAAKILSADCQSIATTTSAIAKGESLKDTVLTLESMGIDVFVVRHSASGAAKFVADTTHAAVINAGDGTHEHPTQGLLDMYTMREAKGSLAGLTVVYIGDISHSRVARSGIWGLLAMGAKVRVTAPATMLPLGIEKFGVEVAPSLSDGLNGADVVNVLRIQLERHKGGLFPSVREYAETFGINSKTIEYAKKDALLMHPGPMNRGVEITPDVADGTRSLITEQVTNGVAIRMALLFLMLGGSHEVEA